MGIARGPNIVKDGLVFGYDTGYGIADNSTATRFYQGEPTTNQADTDAKRNWGTHNGATSSTTTAPEKGPGWKKLIITNINGSNYRLAQFPYLTQANGTTRTYSVEFDVGNLTGYSMFVDGTSGYPPTNVSGKGRYSTTITASGNKSIAVFLGKSGTHSNINHVIYYKEYQVEEKSHASPFTDSTRSDTTSLIDLKRNTNINLSSVSFNSTGQLTFDGTDDKINTGITTQLTDFSCVVVFKDGGSAAWGRLVDKQYTTGFFISSYFASVGTNYVGAGVIEPNSPHGQALQYTTGKYNYFVLTRSGSTHTIYLNGSTNKLQKTNGSSATLSSTEMAIGAWNGSTATQRYTGEIPVVKLYNKELTAAEIQQDFEAYKNRFNL